MTEDIGVGLRELLLADPGVAALVIDRVYPAPAPQDVAFPFITFQRITTTRDYTLEGPCGLAAATFQVDCWVQSREAQQAAGGAYLQARALAKAVRLALNVTNGTIAGVGCSISLANERDLVESEPRLRRCSMDFTILHDEES